MASLTRQNSNSVGAKIFGTVFCLVFLGAGLAFTSFLGTLIYQNLETYTWQNGSCEIISSSLKEEPAKNYTISITYQYDYQSQTYTSTQFERNFNGSDSISTIQGYVDALQPGTTVPCYINPEIPTEAVIKRASLLLGLAILFPLIFVAVGAGGLYLVWKKDSKSSASIVRSNRTSSTSGHRAGFIVFGLFTVLGGIASYFFAYLPIVHYNESMSWVTKTCTVVSSDVRSHSSDDGATYSVDIVYAYDFNGKPYRNNYYNFSSASSSGYQSKHAIVEQHPAGKEVPCYVNPSKPSEAVLVRELGDDLYLALIVGFFLLVGVVGLFFTFKARRKGASQNTSLHYSSAGSSLSVVIERASPLGNLPIPSTGISVLKPSSSPLTRFIAVIFIAAFWNGIISIFVGQAYSSWSSGNPEYGLMLFLTPFVLVGAALIFGIGYTFLSLFNPKIVITLGSGAVSLGQSTSLGWQIDGNAQRIKKLRFWLEGKEEATYRRGTDTRTDKKKFRELEIYSSEISGSFSQGQATIRLPADTMHSWRGSNNKVVWTLHVRGEINKWPDLSEEFEFVVLPLPVSRGVS